MTRTVMERREFLRCLFAAAFGAGTPWRSGAIKQYVQEFRKQALERLPLKLNETTGESASEMARTEISWSRIPESGRAMAKISHFWDEGASLTCEAFIRRAD
jgi:hypothetical protein